jgi:hypothetical protein
MYSYENKILLEERSTMPIMKKQMTEAAKSAAAAIAGKLGMYEQDDITTLSPDQPIMIASAKGISMGTLTIRNMVNMRYISYKLNGETLWEERYEFQGKTGWADKPTTKVFLDEEAILYAGK